MNHLNCDDEQFDMFQKQLGSDLWEIEISMMYKISQLRVLSLFLGQKPWKGLTWSKLALNGEI